MNGFVKGLIWFAAGAATGAGVTYLICTKKYQELYSSGMENISNHYRKKYATLEEKVEKTVERVETAEVAEPKKPVAADLSKEAMKQYKQEPVNYAKTVKPDPIDIHAPAEEQPVVPKEAGIKYIPPETYYDAHSQYDHVELEYFEGDDRLFEQGDLDSEYTAPNTIGEDFRNHWGEFDGDEDVLYVRNEKLGTDFIVIKQQCCSGKGDDEDDEYREGPLT